MPRTAGRLVRVTTEGKKHLERLRAALPDVAAKINEFTLQTFRCRGGRMGSGMGNLIEALWGFYTRVVLTETTAATYDVAWITDHAYNDFALLDASKAWESTTGAGEIFRIEAKSMNLGADETKAHFDVLASQLDEDDQLLVIVWKWTQVEGDVVFPQIVGQFIGPAAEIVALRDALHVARGGSFVLRDACPDGCAPEACIHVGEPLNAAGIRERRSGPIATRGGKTSYAQNFGGLKRMLAARSPESRAVLEQQMAAHPIRREYVEFVRSFPTLNA